MLRPAIAPHEYLVGDAEVAVHVEWGVDGRTVQSLVRVLGVRGEVRLEGRRAVWRRTGRHDSDTASGLDPGRYVLEVGGGSRLPERVPFCQVVSRASVPAGVRVHSLARFRLDEDGCMAVPVFTPSPGPYVEVMKGRHEDTGAPVDLAFDHDGAPLDLAAARERAVRAYLARYGILQPALHARMARAGATDRHDVAIWLRVDDAPAPGEKDPARRAATSPSAHGERAARCAAARDRYLAALRSAARRTAVGDPDAPVVYDRLNAEGILLLTSDASVAAVFLREHDDVHTDWQALRWPYPTICAAAGSSCTGEAGNAGNAIDPLVAERVSHKGRNTLRAGPAVAATAALVQRIEPTLSCWPEGCRAILLAAAGRDVTGPTWWADVVPDVGAQDGSGAPNAAEAARIARHRQGRGNAGTQRGWDVGTVRRADFGTDRLATFRYRVRVPKGSPLGPWQVTVALAWNSEVTALDLAGLRLPLASTLTLDLDLLVHNSAGDLVGYSGSWDNSYEVAEFSGLPGETYDIIIRRWSGDHESWYGIAWTVTSGLLASPSPID
ncbi:MAG TPA: hypothetical protein VLJ59_15520 [Mycobacteriales bacterium]|nr:hypothetical protein [Mycobacteriales bacterium]